MVESALSRQVGGDHYKHVSPQPVEVSFAWKLPFAEGSVLKYLYRWVVKHNIEDLLKCQHWLEMLIEHEQRNGQRYPIESAEQVAAAQLAQEKLP
jgi:hypothetical protein